MIRNFFVTTFRHLFKNRTYALLNILGLSIGLACFTLIGLWVKDEVTYDQFHANADRVYRVAGTFTDESGQFDQAITCIPLAPALVSDLPEVEDALRIDANGAIVQWGDQKFSEDDILGVDPSFFKLFSFKLLRGDAATALNEPYNIVLSESMAKKYFGDKDPIGESLKMFLYDPGNQGADYKITGIIEDCPHNSHFNYNFLFSFKTIEKVDPNAFGFNGWFNNSYFTYVLAKKDASVELLSKKITPFLDKYIGTEMKKSKIRWDYFLQPLTDIHLHSNLRYEIKPTNSLNNIIIFATVGLIVLLLACINYINLSTAYSSDRFREVGVRKVMGAYKNQLIGQYLTESWTLAMVSLLISFVWIELAKPLFESISGNEVTHLYSPETIITLILITSMVGLLAGLYPSFVLSSLKTINVLKGQFKSGTSGVWLRKSLVVVQFTITIILITGILGVNLQLRFIGKKDLGFDKENLLILNVNGSPEVKSGYETFRNELLSNASILNVARSNSMIAGGLGNFTASVADAHGKVVSGTLYGMGIDHNYIDTYRMKLVAGRNFTGTKADSISLMINETTANTYGYSNPEDMIGKEITSGAGKGVIIGVLKDFHYNSLQQKIEPTCLYMTYDNPSRIAVRLSGNARESMEVVLNSWKKHFPNSILEYSFAEDRLQNQYQAEERFSKIFFTFSLLSLAIACLGLFALVSYSVKVRTKEIGIRKVLGASITSITSLLSGEFLLLVIIASVFAMPIAYYFIKQWLQSFAYQVSLGADVFIFAGIITVLIAAVTVGMRSIQSARNNPVDSLRSE